MVRPARMFDAPALHAFASGLALDHPPDRDAHARALAEAIEDERSLVLIAEHDGRAVGSLVAGLLPMPLYGAKLAFLQEVYVDERDIVRLSDFGANAVVRFAPARETFESFPGSAPGADVRQILGRPGEVWAPESGTDRLMLIRTDSS